jgi:hypothetical protein
VAEEPGPSRPVPGAAGRARASASGKLHGAGGQGQERRIGMARTVAGLADDGTWIGTIEAVDMSYPGFFERMAELGEGKGIKSMMRSFSKRSVSNPCSKKKGLDLLSSSGNCNNTQGDRIELMSRTF